MIGRQSQNEGMYALPTPAQATIDGDLKDWDLSGRIWMFADKGLRRRYSGEVAAMWDAQAVYLAIKWRDPTPMYSLVNPAFNPNDGWKSDSVQMRVVAGEQPLWITTWYYTPDKQPVMDIGYWKDPHNCRKGIDNIQLKAAPGGSDLGQGAAMAYRADEDGTGYVQEIRIPWALLFRNTPFSAAAGEKLQFGFELLWGDPTGNTWPVHRYADNMQPGVTTREFYWSSVKSWGNLTLADHGNIDVRNYTSDEQRVEGTVPIRVTVPKDAARTTIAINDAQGRRVRNLAGDVAPEDYNVEQSGDTRTIEVKWDLLDDSGTLVKPGRYQAVGLTHEGLGADYEMCFYNPGTPPWPTRSDAGAWGADHTAPLRVARAGDWMIVSWAFAEGGSGLIGIGPDGLKKWGEKRGAQYLAADAQYVYAVPSGWHVKEDALIRYDRDSGDYQPFVKDGLTQPLELPLAPIIGDESLEPAGLASTDQSLVLLLRNRIERDAPFTDVTRCRIAWLDKASARLVRAIDAPPLVAVTAAPNGDVYAIDEHRIYKVVGEALTPVPTETLAVLSAVTVDNRGNVLVTDIGDDQQVKAIAPDGRMVYTCGKHGGRPTRGKFDPQAMRHMSSVAVDADNNVWVIENWNYPRRVSVWNPADGSLARDYIGNTGYAGTGATLHDTDPGIAYVGPIEIKLNKPDRTWQVTRILWVPDETKGESFVIEPSSHVLGRHFTAESNGTRHNYFFQACYRYAAGYVIFMERGDVYQPVAAVTTVARISSSLTHKGLHEGELRVDFADCKPYDGVYWNDTNGDGAVQRDECTILPSNPTRKDKFGFPIPLGSAWGTRCADDLSFYVNGTHCYTPLRFTQDGAPVYGPDSLSPQLSDERGDFVPVPEENRLLCLSYKNYARPTYISGINTQTGVTEWSYPNPYPGVHGSHNATMPTPGLIIGPLKICGVADMGAAIGRVFLIRGNLGQDFLMTTDGLYVGAMFVDGRIPGESLPSTEQQLVGMPMEAFSHGGEPFNGWFGRQSDGVVRMTTGFPREASMILAVNGLDRIQRFTGPSLNVTPDDVAQADRDNVARAQRDAKPKRYAVVAADKAPRIDGRDNDWSPQPRMEIKRTGFPLQGSARMTYDSDNLYLIYEVDDPSPWRNESKDFTRLFKTGDAVDVQLCVNPNETNAQRRDLGASDVRVVISQLGGKPVAVLMKPIDPSASPQVAHTYQSPVGERAFDRVEVLDDAQVKVSTSDGGYTVEAAIPLVALGLKPAKGITLRGDVGFISSDAAGAINTARTYWTNPNTNLVNDLPLEAWLTPNSWGTFAFE